MDERPEPHALHDALHGDLPAFLSSTRSHGAANPLVGLVVSLRSRAEVSKAPLCIALLKLICSQCSLAVPWPFLDQYVRRYIITHDSPLLLERVYQLPSALASSKNYRQLAPHPRSRQPPLHNMAHQRWCKQKPQKAYAQQQAREVGRYREGKRKDRRYTQGGERSVGLATQLFG